MLSLPPSRSLYDRLCSQGGGAAHLAGFMARRTLVQVQPLGLSHQGNAVEADFEPSAAFGLEMDRRPVKPHSIRSSAWRFRP